MSMWRRFVAVVLAGFLAWAPTSFADPKGVANPSALSVGAASAATVLAQSFVPVSAPADTTEDTLATITVPANTLGANGALRITTFWTFTNGANNKTLRARFSGASGTQYLNVTFTTQLEFIGTTVIGNANAMNSQGGYSIGTYSGGTHLQGGSRITSAVDTTASTTIVLTGQKATAGDTLTLEGYMVEVIKP